ncbi:hypothetical protein [Bremerella alba]|uniref:Uncharacterized protein n=1 Tax=Bremerella alba TaxID=980252 RepID=A0A7V8V8E0_9BACT|nr:hypothetical protein [Bremerella alba]MBA2116790.1 hypothetical protein [Bremerella alba]
MPATWETLWDAVVSQIDGLGLDGLTAANIRQQPLALNPADNELTTGAIVCPVTEAEGNNGTNHSNDIGYGFQVTLVKLSNSALNKTAQQTLLPWRESIRQHFHHQSPLTAHGCYLCTVEHAPVVLPDAWKHQLDASTLVVRCWVLQ